MLHGFVYTTGTCQALCTALAVISNEEQLEIDATVHDAPSCFAVLDLHDLLMTETVDSRKMSVLLARSINGDTDCMRVCRLCQCRRNLIVLRGIAHTCVVWTPQYPGDIY